MARNNNREEEMMQKLEEAKAEAATYFDKVGLTSAFNAYFNSEAVKAQIKTAYAKLTERVNVLAESLPKFRQDRAKTLAAHIVEGEDAFAEAAETNVMLQIKGILSQMEDIMPMDAVAGAPFKRAFEEEADGTLQLNLSKTLDEMVEAGVSAFMDTAMGPAFSVLSAIGDLVGMSQDEMLDILRKEESDEDDADDGDDEESDD